MPAARRLEPRWLAASLALAAVSGGLALVPTTLAVAAFVALAIIAVTAWRPVIGAYMLLGVGPLIIGIDRGAVIPLLRPSEALAILIGGGLLLRWASRYAQRSAGALPSLAPVHLALIGLVIAGAVGPLLVSEARGRPLTSDDLLYALQIPRCCAIYVIVRAAVRTEREVRRCLAAILASSAIIAVVGLMQVVGVEPVSGLLSRYYAPFQDVGATQNLRATSLLSSSIAVGAVMSMSVALAVAGATVWPRWRELCIVLACLFVFCTVAAGQFSGVLLLLVGVGAVGMLTRRLGRIALLGLPVASAALFALSPVIERRFSGFALGGLPRGWQGRISNIETFFLPPLQSHHHWLFGVQPAARVRAPEAWRDWVFIESGHLWLLWSGGVPLLMAFLAFLAVALRATYRRARRATGAIGVAATASFCGLCILAVGMVFDPHLTLRGSADLNFALLALALTRPRDPPP